ncbi:flagellar biosynthetic protein FliO [Fodinibius halophilus]|uniref:Flagellar biosynthetic protein FliO n=1 Tax=Fodinibius halophilus TaxID=1736908 RepID=A0A6M1TFI4_9BACT|nr:flagellar biosynthetic protein FliO [Fodinibius halophilus]NGP87390.1 flagellar biosynthetic protein FliO [Fodinibius halophilus]
MDLRNKLSSLNVPPKKVLKIVLGLSAVLLLIWVFTLSYIDYDADPSASKYLKSKQATDTTAVVKATGLPAHKARAEEQESSSIFTNGMVTFTVLLLILVGIWFWIDKKDNNSTTQVIQREIDNQVLGEGAQLQIVEVNNEIWVLGVTSSSVNLLHRYSQVEWVEQMPEQETAGNEIFAKLFKNNL